MIKKGLIIKSISGEYTVYADDAYICKPRGLFRHHENVPKVGDYVEFDDQEKIIKKIYPRKNELTRPLIANVDQALVVFSVVEPELNLQLLDRNLAILEYNDIDAIIIFTKIDLLDDAKKKQFIPIENYYQAIGYKTLHSSFGTGLEKLPQMLSGKISTCIGQSGVGKSTILNYLDEDLKIKTDIISKALGRGKHTTRHLELLCINDGWLADSPGFGIVDFDGIDILTLSHTFKEFFEISKECKYAKCTHVNEPGCIVKEMVTSEKILPSRYQSYLAFVSEIKTRKVKY